MTSPSPRVEAPTTATVPGTSALPAWSLDPSHSSVEFAVKHLMIATVTGRFKGLRGTLRVSPDAPGLASVEGSVDAASVDTGDAKRDAHLRGEDFFDVANHPEITFRSTQVVLEGKEQAVVTGHLTLRGVTRPVAFQVTFDGVATDPWGNQRVAFTAEAALSRKDFGLTWNQALETGGVLVGDKVRLTLRLSAVQQKDAGGA